MASQAYFSPTSLFARMSKAIAQASSASPASQASQALGDLPAQWTSVLVIECEYMEHNYG